MQLHKSKQHPYISLYCFQKSKYTITLIFHSLAFYHRTFCSVVYLKICSILDFMANCLRQILYRSRQSYKWRTIEIEVCFLSLFGIQIRVLRNGSTCVAYAASSVESASVLLAKQLGKFSKSMQIWVYSTFCSYLTY